MTLTDQFNAADPDFLKNIYGNEDALEDVRKIEERRLEITKKLEEHCHKHREQWTVRQAAKLYTKEKMELNYDPPKPHNSKLHELPWNKHMHAAREMVDWRIHDRMQMLDTTARRMQQNVVEITLSEKYQGMARARLDHEVKEIHQSTHRQRMDTYRDFEANKIQRVEEAKKNLSATPERDVYSAYKQQDRDILANKEHQLGQAYEKHGFNYALEKHELTQKFSQKL